MEEGTVGSGQTKPPEDRTSEAQHERIPVPQSFAERLTAERESRVGEVLDLASRATNSLRYGFPEAAFGSDKPEMMGVAFAQGEGEQQVWQHVPISRVAEATGGERTVDYSSDNPERQMQARVTRGGKTWEMPAIRWDMMVANVEATQLDRLLLEARGENYKIPHLPSATNAQIKPINLGPQRQ